MTIILPDPSAPAERKPGDFKRNAKTGAPYVSDPTGATVKSGDRKGLRKWVMYGRPSGFGDQIENGTNLEKYNQRLIILGLALNRNLLVEAIRFLADGNGDEKAWRKLADKCVNDARDAADADLAANRGTFAHALTHDADMGAEWARRAPEGLAPGIDPEAQMALIIAWENMRTTYGLEVLASEVTVVNDRYRQAGTLDRIVRLVRDLTFVLDGEIVTLPAGTVPVLDIKTGADHRDAGYWNSYAVQIAAYASSVPYDTETETRGEWAWEINERWALIAHLPVAAAIEGEATCSLVLVDLQRGHHAAALCMAARAWEASRDVFGTMHEVVTVEQHAPAAPVTVGGGDSGPTPDPFDGLVVEPTVGVATARTPYVAPVFSEPMWTAQPAPEGAEIDAKTIGRLTAGYERRTPQAKAVIGALIKDAQRAGVAFGQVERNPTERRFELGRACLWIADHTDGDEELVRAAMRLVVGDIPPVQSAPIGAVLGTFTPDEARTLCVVLEGISDGTYVADFATGSLLLKKVAA